MTEPSFQWNPALKAIRQKQLYTISNRLYLQTFWAAPALQTARDTPRIALAPSLAENNMCNI